MLKEFREFIAKGNMLDLAIGIVIGAAFTAIVNSVVKDLISPIVGLLGKANFENQFFILRDGDPAKLKGNLVADYQAAGYVTLNYGAFITAVINFVIVAFVVFMIVKAANRLRKGREAPPPPPEPSNEEKLLIEIRDLLKAKA